MSMWWKVTCNSTGALTDGKDFCDERKANLLNYTASHGARWTKCESTLYSKMEILLHYLLLVPLLSSLFTCFLDNLFAFRLATLSLADDILNKQQRHGLYHQW